MSKSDFGRIVQVGQAAELTGVAYTNSARRLAACAADVLDVLADECGGRPDLREMAASLRSDFRVEAASMTAPEPLTLTVRFDDDAEA